MGLTAALLLAAAVIRLNGSAAASLGALVLSMGVINNTFQRNGEIAIALTYMTGALVRLGQAIGAALMGERRTGTASYALLWGGLFSGALVGALVSTRAEGFTLWLAALAAIALAAFSWRLAGRETG